MANTDNNTIVLSLTNTSPYLEHEAGETITPGMLVKVQADNTVIKHDLAGGVIEKLFAVENPYEGGTIFDDYSSGDLAMIRSARGGDLVLGWYGSLTPIVYGDLLVSNGDGTLRPQGTDSEDIVGIATEAAASPTPPIRVRIRIS